MLVRKVALDPDAHDAVLPLVRALCADPDPLQAAARAALASTLIDRPHERTRPFSRLAVRALLRDRSTGARFTALAQLRALADHAGDGALAADIPDLARPPAEEPDLGARVAAHDVGRTALYDATRLPNGQLLVACGEGGIRWVTRDGRPVAHFDVPAHRLVVSDHGDRVLAVAPRGSALLVSKVDLHERRAKPWLDLELVGHADTCDGAVWYVLERHAVVALDLLTRRRTALWRVDVDGVPERVARSGTQLIFSVFDGEHHEVWRYQLPGATLRSRTRMPDLEGGGVCVVGVGERSAMVRADALELTHPRKRYADPELAFQEVALGDGLLSTLARGPHHSEVQIYDSGVLRGRIVLQGDAEAFLRIQGEEILVGDRAGRLVVRSLDEPARRLDLRL